MREYWLLPSRHLLSSSASHRSVWSGWDHSSATVDCLSDVSTLLLFGFLPLSLLTPGPCPGLYVLFSHVFWGSSGLWGWSLRLPFLLRYLMLSHQLSEIMDFQRRLKQWSATPSAWSYSYSLLLLLIAESGRLTWLRVRTCPVPPCEVPLPPRLSYTIWQRVPCAVSIHEEGSYAYPQRDSANWDCTT